MTDAHERYDRVVSTLSRRQAIAGGATLLTAGGTLVWVGDDARAAVSIESFDASSAEFHREEIAPVVDATLAYEYDVGNQVVGAVRAGLAVDGTEVASETLRTDRTTLSNETQLAAPVTDSDAWSVDDFAPDVASSVSREVTVTATFAVLDDSDETIVSDSASDTATLTVSHPQASEYSVAVGGEATFRTPK